MSTLLAFNRDVRRENKVDKPEHISLAAQRVLAGIKSRRDKPVGVREETPTQGNGTARAECLHGTTAFDGNEQVRRSAHRVGPQAVSLVSQTPVRACEVPPTRGQFSGCADALGEGAPIRNGSTVTVAVTCPEQVSHADTRTRR